MLEQSFQETTIQHSVTVETSGDAGTSSDIQSSVDLADNEIETIEVVCKQVYYKGQRTFYIQLEERKN